MKKLLLSFLSLSLLFSLAVSVFAQTGMARTTANDRDGIMEETNTLGNMGATNNNTEMTRYNNTRYDDAGTAGADRGFRGFRDTGTDNMNNGLRATAANDNRGNWGWLGLLGLVGLYGAFNRNRETQK